MNVRLVRNGELPPGVVDGYCTACSGDVLVSGPEYVCPTCETPVHPDSLPREDRLKVLAARSEVQSTSQPAAPTSASKSILLPRVDDLVKWRRETVFRRDRLLEQEQSLDNVRRARKALDRVLEAIQLEPEEDDDGN